jgi:hypothetical protein
LATLNSIHNTDELDSDECSGGSYSPTDLCAQAMGREDLFAAS